jgi:hypothetical protein
MKTKITNLEPHGANRVGETHTMMNTMTGKPAFDYIPTRHGWQWTETKEGYATETTFRTDYNGGGLWVYSNARATWDQILGTSQFLLPATRRAAMAKLCKVR